MRRLLSACALLCVFATAAFAGGPEAPPSATPIIDALLKLIFG